MKMHPIPETATDSALRSEVKALQKRLEKALQGQRQSSYRLRTYNEQHAENPECSLQSNVFSPGEVVPCCWCRRPQVLIEAEDDEQGGDREMPEPHNSDRAGEKGGFTPEGVDHGTVLSGENFNDNDGNDTARTDHVEDACLRSVWVPYAVDGEPIRPEDVVEQFGVLGAASVVPSSEDEDVETSSEIVLRPKSRFAHVAVLFGDKIEYLMGALILGYSLKDSRHDVVLLYTSDVPKESLRYLRSVFTFILEVDYLTVGKSVAPRLYKNAERTRFKDVFTKLQIFCLDCYEKVLFLDLDTLVRDVAAVDDLLENGSAPAALQRGDPVLQTVKDGLPSHETGRIPYEEFWKNYERKVWPDGKL
ncbi:unnamed protein product, partial [Amoebophrya sp. A120]|eukprot:GSA120T00011748001.1